MHIHYNAKKDSFGNLFCFMAIAKVGWRGFKRKG